MPELFEIFIAPRLGIYIPRIEFSIYVEVKLHWDLEGGGNLMLYIVL